MRILIVDDVSDNIRILSRILGDEGHHILTATSGRQALNIVEICVPDLILLDVMMPEMDGYRVCATLKANPALNQIPIIFITALNDPEDEVYGLSLGAVDYITKPFKEAIVRLRVNTHLKLKRQHDLLNQLSYFDGLTGVQNRRAFDERLPIVWQQALCMNSTLAAAMIDIDFFKNYNDSNGHLAGDDCLRSVASTLAQIVNINGHFFARYGGEEFVCLFQNITADGLVQITKQLRKAVEFQHYIHGSSCISPWVTISIGAVWCCPSVHSSASALIEQADAQLYRAKAQGRNQVSMCFI